MNAAAEVRRAKVEVVVAFRGGCIGYFRTLAEVPPDFKVAPEHEEISGIMSSMNLIDVDECLRIMNHHWKRVPGVQTVVHIK